MASSHQLAGSFEREIAARLARGHPAKPRSGRQNVRENATRLSYQSWLPGIANTSGRAPARECEFVRRLGARVVFGARGIRIDLVATEHQHLSALGLYRGAVVLERELRTRDGIRDGERRIPAIADVRGVVEPEVTLRRRIVELALRLARERFDESRIRMAAEDVGDRDLVGRMREHARVVPADHRAALGSAFPASSRHPASVSTGGWFTTERVASQPAKQTNKPPPTRP